MSFRWFKKIARAILNLLPFLLIAFFSFFNFSDVSALRHEYKGLSLLSPLIPAPQHDTNNYIDWNTQTSDFAIFSAAPFFFKFEGSAWSDSLENLRARKDIRYVRTVYDSVSGKCKSLGNSYPFSTVFRNRVSPIPSGTGIVSSSPEIFPQNYGVASVTFNNNYDSTYTYFPDFYQGEKYCISRSGMSSIDLDSYDYIVNHDLPSWPNSSDLALYKPLSVINNDNVFPYNYYTDTLTFSSSKKNSNGVVFNKQFSFSTIFNQSLTSFSYLSLGLNEYSGYWYDDSNFFSGRDIDFKFRFGFEKDIVFEDTFIQGGSLKLEAVVVPKHYDSNLHGLYNSKVISFDCTSTKTQIGDISYEWAIDCPVTLAEDYILFVPQLIIDGNGNKVFSTDGNWNFSAVYIVTDHDDTPGRDFNDSPTGNTDLWDSYWSDPNSGFHDSEPDWTSSLTSLFSFNLLNPFAPLFTMFTDDDSCASIPTLSSMLSSEETVVCHFFPSSVRTIVTPVLTLSSMMLLFGFAVRWLGARSGNFIEDSGSIESPGFSATGGTAIKHGWRVKK